MSVYKRGGVYRYDFWFRAERFQATTGLRNRTAASRAEAIRKAELAEGRAGIRARKATPLFEKFVQDEFLPWAESEHRAGTYTRYAVSAKALVVFFGKYRLEVISAGLVGKFKVSRLAVLTGAGTNREMPALRLMLNYAKRLQYIDRNPVCDVSFLDEGEGNMRIVSHEEQRKYLSVASPLVHDVALLIVETGMRPE